VGFIIFCFTAAQYKTLDLLYAAYGAVIYNAKFTISRLTAV